MSKKGIFILAVMFFGSSVDLKAMKRIRDNGEFSLVSSIKKQKKETLQELNEDEFIVYSSLKQEDKEENEIVVSLETLMLSKTMFNLRNDFNGFLEKRISLPFSQDVIKTLFDLLKDDLTGFEEILQKKDLRAFIDVANCANYLDIPTEQLNMILSEGTAVIQNMDLNELEQLEQSGNLDNLNPDLKKIIISTMLASSHESLRSEMIIRKPSIERGKEYASFNRAGNKIVYVTNENFLVSEDSNSGEIIFLKKLDELVCSMSFSFNDRVVVEYLDHKFDVFDLNTSEEIFTIGAQQGFDSLCKISDCGNLIATTFDGYVHIWDIRKDADSAHMVLKDRNYIGKDQVSCLSFSPCGKYMVTGCSDSGIGRGLIIWSINDPENILRIPVVGYEDCVVADVHWITDKKIIIGLDCSQNNIIVLEIKNDNEFVSHVISGKQELSMSKEVQEKKIIGHAERIKYIRLSNDGTRMVSSSLGKKDNLFVWDISDLSAVRNINLNPQRELAIKDCNISSDGKTIVFDYSNREIVIHQVQNFENIQKYCFKMGTLKYFFSLSQNNFIFSGCDSNGFAQGTLKQISTLSLPDYTLLDRELNYRDFAQAKLISSLCRYKSEKEAEYKKKLSASKLYHSEVSLQKPVISIIISNPVEKKIFATLPDTAKVLLKDHWHIEEK